MWCRGLKKPAVKYTLMTLLREVGNKKRASDKKSETLFSSTSYIYITTCPLCGSGGRIGSFSTLIIHLDALCVP